MALKIELDARAKKLESILADINAALVERNVAAAENYSDIAAAISAIDDPDVILQDITVTENGSYTADSGYDGLGKVNVNVAGGTIEAGLVFKEITAEGKVIRAKAYGAELPQYAFAGQDELIEVDIPADLDIIRSNSFYNCRTLPYVELGDSIEGIDGNAFYDCRELALTKLPAALKTIATSAFYRCLKLTVSEIPAGVTEIKGNAFNYCSAITSITFKGTPAALSSTSFNNCSALAEINVPWAEGAVANAPWGAYSAIINYNYTGA